MQWRVFCQGLLFGPALSVLFFAQACNATDTNVTVAEDVKLQQLAHKTFMASQYEETIQYNLRLANEFPQSRHRRYAVMMLGMIYENNVFQYEQAIHWYQVFLRDYAAGRQERVIQRRIDFLRSLGPYRNAHIEFRKIQLSEIPHEEKVEKLEAFIAKYPQLPVMQEALRNLSGEYKLTGQYHKYYTAFRQSMEMDTATPKPDKERYIAYACSVWRRAALAYLGWVFVAAIAVWTLALRPWKTVCVRDVKSAGPFFLAWAALTAVGAVVYLVKIRYADHNPFTFTRTLAFCSIPFLVLIWHFLHVRAEFWKSRQKALARIAPLLSFFLAGSLSYLLIFHIESWIFITDEFKYQLTDFFTTIADFFKGGA